MFGHCKISHTSTSTYILYSSSFLFSSFLCFTLSFSSLSLFYLSLHLYFYPPTFLPPSLFYTPSYSEQRKVCQACYQVVKSYLRGDSRKNENYLARFIKFFQTQVDTHTHTHTYTHTHIHTHKHRTRDTQRQTHINAPLTCTHTRSIWDLMLKRQ